MIALALDKQVLLVYVLRNYRYVLPKKFRIISFFGVHKLPWMGGIGMGGGHVCGGGRL